MVVELSYLHPFGCAKINKERKYHMKKFFGEFKAFISRGNVLNLAVGIIIGAAFGAIIGSLVNDIIMPPISLLLGNEVSLLKWVIRPEVLDIDGITVLTKEIAIRWGLFLQAVLNFLIIAFVLFVIIRIVTRLNKKAEALKARKQAVVAVEEKPAPAPEPSEEVLLLREIVKALNAKK